MKLKLVLSIDAYLIELNVAELNTYEMVKNSPRTDNTIRKLRSN